MARPLRKHHLNGMDPHADKRDRKREKQKYGHVETGRSAKLLNELIGKRATGVLPPTSGKGRKHR